MNGTISQQQRNPYAQMQPQGFQTSTQQAQAAPNSSAGGQALQIAPASQTNLSVPYYQGQQPQTVTMACLFTKQKTQKRKTWHDGKLLLHAFKAVLHDAHPAPGAGDAPLAECELSGSQRDLLVRQLESRLETEKLLIQVAGPWINRPPTVMQQQPLSAPRIVSQGMQKVMTRKFQKPKTYVPPHPSQARQALGKRPRSAPLQPGELTRRYYGDAAAVAQASPPLPFPQGPGWTNDAFQYGGQQPPTTAIPSFPQAASAPPPPAAPPHQVRSRQSLPQNPPVGSSWGPEATAGGAPLHFSGQEYRQSNVGQAPPAATTSASPSAPTAFSPWNPSPVAPRPPQAKENQNPAQSIFTNNAFDPSSFYGEEEEEEASNDGFSHAAPWHGPGATTSSNGGTNQVPQHEATRSVSDSTDTVSKETDEQSPLSTNELLDAFGVGGAPPAVEEVTKRSSVDPVEEQAAVEKQFELPPASDSSDEE